MGSFTAVSDLSGRVSRGAVPGFIVDEETTGQEAGRRKP